MERSHPFLVLLLLSLAASASVSTVGASDADAAAAAACSPTELATQVALFCSSNVPTPPCCEPVVAAVDLGGGVPCLCRVATEPPLVVAGLNASHLLRLYSSCGGLRRGGSQLAAACEGAPATDAAAPSPGDETTRGRPRPKPSPPSQPSRRYPPPPPRHLPGPPGPPSIPSPELPIPPAAPTYPAPPPTAPNNTAPPPHAPNSSDAVPRSALHAAPLAALVVVFLPVALGAF